MSGSCFLEKLQTSLATHTRRIEKLESDISKLQHYINAEKLSKMSIEHATKPLSKEGVKKGRFTVYAENGGTAKTRKPKPKGSRQF